MRFISQPNQKLSLKAICLLSSLIFYTACHTTHKTSRQTYTVHVAHPGVESTEATEQSLHKQWNPTRQESEYFIDTNSVYCSSNICKVVPVRIYWNDLGQYQNYELGPKIQLEKAEGIPFTLEDHERLNQILKDAESPLKDIQMSDIQNHENTNTDIDVETSATPPAYAGIAVEGAAWTTYTLWHWAHSSLTEEIMQRTRDEASTPELNSLLEGSSSEHKLFALTELSARSSYSSETINSICNLSAENNSQIIIAALRYWTQSTDEIFAQSFSAFYLNCSQQERIIMLESIRASEFTLTIGQLDQIGSMLPNALSYQEVNTMLNIMEQDHQASTTIAQSAAQLLQHSNFLIARRAYWFLSDFENMTTKQVEQLNTFKAQHSDRL